MADKKTFTAAFDLAGNLSSRFPAIKKMIDGFENTKHEIVFRMNDNEVIQKSKNITSALERASNATRSNTEAQKNATTWSNALGKAAGLVNDTVNKGTDSSSKHKSAIESLQNRYKSFTGSLGDLKEKLAGVFALMSGAAVAGISWVAAETSASYSSSVMERLGQRVGTRKVDTEALDAFVNQASKSGYSSSTDRLQLANLMITRGSKNTDQTIAATDALEKLFFKESAMFEKDFGITSAKQLAELATQKNVKGDIGKDLDYIFGTGFSNLSQSARIKKLGRMGVDIDINAAMNEKPLEVIQVRLKSVTKAIGDELRGPMNQIAGVVAKILEAFDRNPALPKIAAMGAALMAVSGVLITIVGLLPLLKTGVGAVADGFSILGKAANFSKMAGLLMSPIGLLIALGAILVIVAYKTGMLQKAWDKFSSSAIGKDLIGAIQSVSDWVGGLIDRFSKWYEASGKNQMLDYFFKFCEVLGYAWDYIDKIYSTMKGSGIPAPLAALMALQAVPAALAAGAFKAATGRDPSEILEGISGYIQGLLSWATSNASALMDKVYGILKKMQSIWEWIYSLWQSGIQWIRDGLGLTKQDKEKKMLEYAEKKGVKWLDSSDYSWFKGAGWYSKWWNESGKKVENPRLDKLREDYLKAPGGFGQGIADAVRNGISNLTINGIDDLTNAINDLIDALELKGTVGAAANFAHENLPGKEAREVALSRDQQFEALGFRNGVDGFEIKKNGEWVMASGEDEAAAEVAWVNLARGSGNAAGITFTRSGMFTGKVHEHEELVSQASSRKGPGVLAKSIEALDAIMSGRPVAAGVGAGSKVEVHIHNQNDFDFRGSKIASTSDMKPFFSKIDDRIKKVSVEAVKNSTGKRR